MPSLRRLYNRLRRRGRKHQGTKKLELDETEGAQQAQNAEAVNKHPEPDQARNAIPSIQLRQSTAAQDLDGPVVPRLPSTQSPKDIHHSAAGGLRRRGSARSYGSTSDSKASSATSMYWLKEQLHNARFEAADSPHAFFVPRSFLEGFVTVELVAKVVFSGAGDNLDELQAQDIAKKVCLHARQLFATLVCVKRPLDIALFLEEGITDADLPFLRKHNAPIMFDLYRKDGTPIKAIGTWKEKYRENFDRMQWWMTAPVFRPNEDLYQLDDKTILPFLPLEPHGYKLEPKQGGYSEVYPVLIHPAHHEFWHNDTGRIEDERLVAVKRLYSSDETEFLKEATILNAVGLKRHAHLIKLLATYKHKEKYHLMFPYANANLRKYWDDRPSPDFNRENVLWSLKQMTGIANGLLRIHTFTVTYPLRATSGAGSIRMPKDAKLMVKYGEEWFGRHGDIKPENILWFRNDCYTKDPKGVLQIADFGLGRFHGRDSRSGVNPETVQTSPTYEPPECKLRQPVSRAYDMWSLGCLYLEFLTWLLKGSQEIEAFSDFRGREATDTGIDDDNFYTLVNNGDGMHAIVRESVVTWKNKLHTHEKCSQLIHDLLELTMGGLLVTDTKKRWQASWLYQQLKMYLIKAEEDSDYMLKPVAYAPKAGHDRSKSARAIYDGKSPRANTSLANLATDTNSVPVIPVKKFVRMQHPKDLVQRKAGTLGFRSELQLRAYPTWPAGSSSDSQDHFRGRPWGGGLIDVCYRISRTCGRPFEVFRVESYPCTCCDSLANNSAPPG